MWRFLSEEMHKRPPTELVTVRHACDGPSCLWRSVGESIVQLLKEDGEVWPSVGLRSAWQIVVVTTDRHGLRRPILMQFLLLLFFITLDGKTLQLSEYVYWDYFSELHDEPAGRTVVDTTNRHKFRNPTLGQTSPSSFSSCTMMPPTDHHGHDEPSQAP